MKFYLLTYSLTKFILQIIRIKTQRKSKTLIILILLRTSKNITFYKIFHGCPLKLDTLLMNCSQSILPVTLSFQICSPKNFMTLCLCSSFDLNLLFVFFYICLISRWGSGSLAVLVRVNILISIWRHGL